MNPASLYACWIWSVGLLPKPPRLGLWGKSGQDERLDATKRFLHVTTDALVLEVEGEDKVSATLYCVTRGNRPCNAIYDDEIACPVSYAYVDTVVIHRF